MTSSCVHKRGEQTPRTMCRNGSSFYQVINIPSCIYTKPPDWVSCLSPSFTIYSLHISRPWLFSGRWGKEKNIKHLKTSCHTQGKDKRKTKVLDRFSSKYKFHFSLNWPLGHFRKTNTESSMHFRKANREPSMRFRRERIFTNLSAHLSLTETSSGKNFCQEEFH